MSIDYVIHIGHYIRARGPLWIGPHCPFDEWLYGDGNEALTEMRNNCDGPFKDGWRGWRENTKQTDALHITPPHDETGVFDAPVRYETGYASVFSVELAKLRESYREVEICYGVVFYAY